MVHNLYSEDLIRLFVTATENTSLSSDGSTVINLISIMTSIIWNCTALLTSSTTAVLSVLSLTLWEKRNTYVNVATWRETTNFTE